MATTLTVGQFTLDADNQITGPATYLAEQGNAKIGQILAGACETFNRGREFQSDVRTLLLVVLQTDFAGWLGERQMFGPRKGG